MACIKNSRLDHGHRRLAPMLPCGPIDSTSNRQYLRSHPAVENWGKVQYIDSDEGDTFGDNDHHGRRLAGWYLCSSK